MLEVEPRASCKASILIAHLYLLTRHFDFFLKDASYPHTELPVAQVLPWLTLHPHSFIENVIYSLVLFNSPPTLLMPLLHPSLSL